MFGRVLLSTTFMIAFCATAAAERRVALVIGNGAYKSAAKLPNPPQDAEAIAGMLAGNGFEVVLGTDLSREGMLERLSKFSASSGGADVALFFYAGHGIQIGGKNLIVPVDADLKTELDAKTRTIDLDELLQATMGDAKVKLVLLDACRDNPFVGQIKSTLPPTRSGTVNMGLAKMEPGEGTTIAFATGPGQVALDGDGKNSPFTRALLAHLPKPGLEIDQALKLVRGQVQEETRRQQLPWSNTNMTGFFYMQKPDAVAVAATGQQGTAVAALSTPASGTAAGSTADSRTFELEFWNSVKASGSASDLKAYVDKYPNGTFTDLARSRIAALAAPSAPAAGASRSGPPVASTELRTSEATEATENALGLDRNAWRELQRRLTALGHTTGGVDGGIGPNTRKGVTAWQNARGYTSSGFLNKLQHEALLAENVPNKEPATAAAEPETRTRSTRSSSGGSSGSSSSGRSSGGSSGSGSAGAAGEFVGGVVRGVTRGRLPF